MDEEATMDERGSEQVGGFVTLLQRSRNACQGGGGHFRCAGPQEAVCVGSPRRRG